MQKTWAWVRSPPPWASPVLLIADEGKGKCRMGGGGGAGRLYVEWVLRQTALVRIPALPATSCGALGELLNLPESLFPRWQHGNNNAVLYLSWDGVRIQWENRSKKLSTVSGTWQTIHHSQSQVKEEMSVLRHLEQNQTGWAVGDFIIGNPQPQTGHINRRSCSGRPPTSFFKIKYTK